MRLPSVHRPLSLVVVSAGAGDLCLTRLIADQIAESAYWSLSLGGERVDLQVLELRRLEADLAHHAADGHTGPDLREAIAAVTAADALVVATPVVLAAPDEVFDAFFTALEEGVLSGMPVLLATVSRSRRPAPTLGPVMRGRFTCWHAQLVPTVVVTGPQDWDGPAGGSGRLREHIDQGAAELAAAVHLRTTRPCPAHPSRRKAKLP